MSSLSLWLEGMLCSRTEWSEVTAVCKYRCSHVLVCVCICVCTSIDIQWLSVYSASNVKLYGSFIFFFIIPYHWAHTPNLLESWDDLGVANCIIISVTSRSVWSVKGMRKRARLHTVFSDTWEEGNVCVPPKEVADSKGFAFQLGR